MTNMGDDIKTFPFLDLVGELRTQIIRELVAFPGETIFVKQRNNPKSSQLFRKTSSRAGSRSSNDKLADSGLTAAEWVPNIDRSPNFHYRHWTPVSDNSLGKSHRMLDTYYPHPISRTCKQLHDEATYVFLSDNHFEFESWVVLFNWMSNLDDTQAASLKSIVRSAGVVRDDAEERMGMELLGRLLRTDRFALRRLVIRDYENFFRPVTDLPFYKTLAVSTKLRDFDFTTSCNGGIRSYTYIKRRRDQ
jgi:hypothetical protein